MTPFQGIPAGRVAVTPVPNVIFSELLPLMDDLAEVRVTLHVFYLLYQKKGSPRYVTHDELRSDATLMRALSFEPEMLERALARAVAHAALLEVQLQGAPAYLFNTAEGRRALERIARGELGQDARVPPPAPPAQEIPNIFKLYEQQIGPLTPLIADELKEAELEYPPDVILNAFRIAAENNARKWSYVRAVLLDWTREHKHEKTRRPSPRRRPTITGRLADVAKPK